MLKAFLSSLPDDAARREWAISCGTTLGHLRNCIYAPKPPAPETCVLIERNSAQRVRRWHLRPDDWHRIWPELIDLHKASIVGELHQTVSTGLVKRRANEMGQSVTHRTDGAAAWPAVATQQEARNAA